jgi:hypothetical protein
MTGGTPSRDKKAGPSPMLDPRAWSLSTPQAREAFVTEVGPRDIEAVIKAIRLNDQLPEAAKKGCSIGPENRELAHAADLAVVPPHLNVTATTASRFFERRLSVMTRHSDHRKSRALFVPVENQGTNTYPKAVGFASLLVPSILNAKFQAQP